MDLIVLRDLRTAPPSDPFGAGTAGLESLEVVPPEVRIDVESVETREVPDLARDPEVKALARPMPTKLIEPVGPATSAAGDSWGIAAVGADTSPRTGAGTLVAVLDTGIDASHDAFAGVDLVQRDFSGSGDGDKQGHGTHCAGTVLGRDVGGQRIGVARGVERALIGKVLGDDGGGASDMLFRGMTWAIQEGAHVVSMSLGFDFPGSVQEMVDGGWPADLATSGALESYRANLRMFDALMAMVRAQEPFGAGTLVVAASGNESRRDEDPDHEIAVSLPAAADGVVAVGAAGRPAAGGTGLVIAPFSNTFPQISAPGVQVTSARSGGGTVAMSGTSMATPHVAGLAALWWEEVRASALPATARTVTARLLSAARIDVFAAGVDVADRGTGLATAPQ